MCFFYSFKDKTITSKQTSFYATGLRSLKIRESEFGEQYCHIGGGVFKGGIQIRRFLAKNQRT